MATANKLLTNDKREQSSLEFAADAASGAIFRNIASLIRKQGKHWRGNFSGEDGIKSFGSSKLWESGRGLGDYRIERNTQ